MIEPNKLPVIVDKEAIEQSNKEYREMENTLSTYKQAMKGVEEFLTFIYHNSETFRKLKERFNEQSDFCRFRMKDNRIKVEVYDR